MLYFHVFWDKKSIETIHISLKPSCGCRPLADHTFLGIGILSSIFKLPCACYYGKFVDLILMFFETANRLKLYIFPGGVRIFTANFKNVCLQLYSTCYFVYEFMGIETKTIQTIKYIIEE